MTLHPDHLGLRPLCPTFLFSILALSEILFFVSPQPWPPPS